MTTQNKVKNTSIQNTIRTWVLNDGSIQKEPVPRGRFLVFLFVLVLLLLLGFFAHDWFILTFSKQAKFYPTYWIFLAILTAFLFRGRFKSAVETVVITSVFFVIYLSFSQLKESILLVTVHTLPEAFVNETHISRESMEDDIIGKINEIRWFAKTDESRVYMEDGNTEADRQIPSSTGSGKSANIDEGNPTGNDFPRKRDYDFNTSIDSENQKNQPDLRIESVGMSLQSMLQSLKRQEWIRQMFGYRFTTVTGDMVWSKQEKSWILVLRYADMGDGSVPVQRISWDDSALSKFGELAWRYYDHATVLSYYNDHGRDADLDRLCDDLIIAGTDSDLAYYYKGQVAHRRGDYRRALLYHDSAIASRKDGRNNQYFVEKAQDLRDLNRQRDAMIILDDVLQNEPVNAHALYAKADLLDDMGLYEESASLLKRLNVDGKAKQENNAKYYSLNAYVAYQSGDVDDALAGYDQTILLNPKESWYYHLKGWILEQMSDQPEKIMGALASYEEALKLDPKNPTYYDDKRRLFIIMGRQDEIEGLLKKALENFPDNKSATDLKQQGQLYGLFGKYDQAVAAYEAAIKINPNDPIPYNSEGIIWKDNLDKSDKAKPLFEKAVSLDGDNLQYRFVLGLALNDLNKYSEASKMFESIIAMDPYYVEAYRGKALVLEGQDKKQEALSSREKTVELNPGSGYYHYWKASLQEDMGDEAGAIDEYKKAADLSRWRSDAAQRNHKVAQLLYDKGACSDDGLFDDENRMKACVEAKDYYSRSLDANPKYVDSLVGKASLLNDFDSNDEALLLVDLAIGIESKNAWAYNLKGYILCDQYENSKSDEAFRMAHKLNPTSYETKNCWK